MTASLPIAYPVAPVIERLELQVPRLKLVGASADLTAALTTPPPVQPAAYVLQTSKGHPPQWSDTQFAQKIDSVVQVVLWVRNYSQARTGAAARTDMDTLLGEVGGALCGFAPTNKFWPLWFGTSTDEQYDAGWLTSQITFFSDFSIRS